MKRLMILIYFCTILTANAMYLPPTKAQHAMVVTSQHLASDVGLSILKQGGNAIDSAVAIGYALAVVETCCGNIGGGGFMLIHFANGNNVFLNFRETAPSQLNIQNFLDADGNVIPEKTLHHALASGVPGTVLGLNTALQKYGTMSLQQIMTPAIKLAKEGYVLTPGDVTILDKGTIYFKKNPDTAKIFLKNNQTHNIGDRLKQPALAHTLEQIAKEGSRVFYQGNIADTIVTANQKQGGVMIKEDLMQYQIKQTTPITCDYRGYTIITAALPSSGGIGLCEILGVTEGYPLSYLGFHSAMSAHFVIEAMRAAYADRNEYLGDPDFVKVPVEKLLSPEHLSTIRENIQPFRANSSGSFDANASEIPEGTDTTHYSVVDDKGNAVAVTYTINNYFGNTLMAGDAGFFMNNEMDDFTIQSGKANKFGLMSGKQNLLAPNKRPLSAMTPTIILKENKLFMVLGAPGGSTIPTQITQAIQNVIDYGMDIQSAVDEPRFHMQWFPDVVFMEPFTFSNDTQEKLAMMGYTLQLGSPYHTPRWGAVAAILRDPTTGALFGAIDSRRPAGAAVGY